MGATKYNSKLAVKLALLIFGGAISACCRRHRRNGSAWRAGVFIAACIAAYVLSIMSALLIFRMSLGSGSEDLALSASFGVGLVGAFIVLGSGLFLFAPGNADGRPLGRLVLSILRRVADRSGFLPWADDLARKTQPGHR